jgi:hypothetical protein
VVQQSLKVCSAAGGKNRQTCRSFQRIDSMARMWSGPWGPGGRNLGGGYRSVNRSPVTPLWYSENLDACSSRRRWDSRADRSYTSGEVATAQMRSEEWVGPPFPPDRRFRAVA